MIWPDKAGALCARMSRGFNGQDALTALVVQRTAWEMDNWGGVTMAEISNTLDTMHDQQAIVAASPPPRKYIVRRLTPLECCRLQGFPDWWTDGVEGSDSAKYKMWGNGIALPCAVDVLRRIAKEVDHGAAQTCAQ